MPMNASSESVENPREAPRAFDAPRVRRAVLTVALLNFGYFFVEFFVALGWALARRAVMGKVMAVVILVPAAFAAWEAAQRFTEPVAPDVLPVVLASFGAIVINGTSALVIARVRHHGGSLGRAAFLSARNDVLVNVAIIIMALITAWTRSGWPDLVLGCLIILLALHAGYEVWEVSEEERLAAKALAGEEID